MLQKITIVIPTEVLGMSSFPLELLEYAEGSKFLSIDINGFLFVCRVPKDRATAVAGLMKKASALRIERIKLGQRGEYTVLVEGKWWSGNRSREMDILSAIGRSGVFSTGEHQLTPKGFQVSLIGEPVRLRRVTSLMDQMRVPYTIVGLSRAAQELNKNSPFGSLTVQQSKVLRLAFMLGYYEVPRQMSTEQLADILKLDKGTVGECLRRAERHVMKELFARATIAG